MFLVVVYIVFVVLFLSCSYWVKLRLIKVQQTLPEATVVVVVIVVVFVNVIIMFPITYI